MPGTEPGGRATLLVQLGEAGYTVCREVPQPAFAVPSAATLFGGDLFLSGFRNLLEAAFPERPQGRFAAPIAHITALESSA